jgi:hypothetical protein
VNKVAEPTLQLLFVRNTGERSGWIRNFANASSKTRVSRSECLSGADQPEDGHCLSSFVVTAPMSVPGNGIASKQSFPDNRGKSPINPLPLFASIRHEYRNEHVSVKNRPKPQRFDDQFASLIRPGSERMIIASSPMYCLSNRSFFFAALFRFAE